MSMSEEDREQVAESVSFSDAGPDAYMVRALLATVDWDENPAPGRPHVTGTWRLEFRDPIPEKVWRIDLPQDSLADVEHDVAGMVARRLAGETDLSGGQPHIFRAEHDG
jgi:hypothetical protein